MAFNWRKFPWTNLHELNLDWIIQTVKTLEENLTDALALVQTTVDTAITKLLTGSGDLTINKTGDVKISGRSVTIYPVKIPADIVDISEYAATCGFVSMEVENMTTMLDNDIDTERTERLAGDTALQSTIDNVKDTVNDVSGELDTEISNRTSGDAALQSTIDGVIMPLINALRKRAPRVFYFENDTTTNTTQTMTAEDSAALKAALVDHTPVMLIAKTQGEQYCYLPVNCSPVPTADNINDPNTEFSYTFQTANNVYRAYVSCSGSGTPSIAVFQTIS